MKQLPTLSIKCDRCGHPQEFRRLPPGLYSGAELGCPGCEGAQRLNSVELALLSLIADQTYHADVVVKEPVMAVNPTIEALAADIITYICRQHRRDHMHEEHQDTTRDVVARILKKAITP